MAKRWFDEQEVDYEALWQGKESEISEHWVCRPWWID